MSLNVEAKVKKLYNAPGKSAYEIAVENGFVGTEEEWLESLKGEQGIQGIQGEKGDKGEQGIQGEKGATGAPFMPVKTYPSKSAMDADFSGTDVEIGQLVMIVSSEDDPDNAKVYVKTNTQYQFVVDLSGQPGIVGPQGEPGKDAESAVGIDGKFAVNLIPKTAGIYNIGGRTKPIKSVYATDFKVTDANSDHSAVAHAYTALKGDVFVNSSETLAEFDIGMVSDISGDDITAQENKYATITMNNRLNYSTYARYFFEGQAFKTFWAEIEGYDCKAQVTAPGDANLKLIVRRNTETDSNFIGYRTNNVVGDVDFRSMPWRYIKVSSKNVYSVGDGSIIPNSFEFVIIGGINETFAESRMSTIREFVTNWLGMLSDNWVPCVGHYTDADGNVYNVKAINCTNLQLMLDSEVKYSKLYDLSTIVSFDMDTEIYVNTKRIVYA